MSRLNAVLIPGLLVAFGAGYLFAGAQSAPALLHNSAPDQSDLVDASSTEERLGQGGPATHLTNPLLDCSDLSNAISESGVDKLKTEITTLISQSTSTGTLIDAGVYYRDLNDGPWMLAGDNYLFSPASILKVPLAMAYYREAESNPKLLDKTVVYKPDPSLAGVTQPYSPTEDVVAGKTYTVRELIRLMLEQSSNGATVTLQKMQTEGQISQVYTDLGLPRPDFFTDYSVSIRDIGSFMRILYNATYLSRTDSEMLLSQLSDASYTQGLVAGVPPGTVVAHKFGSRGLPDGSVELTDCGIIYTKDPYLLCVGTHGANFALLSSFIASVSRITYGYVSSGN